eukprot:scaffold16087_cov112-Isochrysis_galbana.AAC.2
MLERARGGGGHRRIGRCHGLGPKHGELSGERQRAGARTGATVGAGMRKCVGQRWRDARSKQPVKARGRCRQRESVWSPRRLGLAGDGRQPAEGLRGPRRRRYRRNRVPVRITAAAWKRRRHHRQCVTPFREGRRRAP